LHISSQFYQKKRYVYFSYLFLLHFHMLLLLPRLLIQEKFARLHLQVDFALLLGLGAAGMGNIPPPAFSASSIWPWPSFSTPDSPWLFASKKCMDSNYYRI
jgi:hypothetical protein